MTIYENISRLYGQPTPNQDPANGIHYGVVSANSLFNCAEEFYDHAEDLTHAECVAEVKKQIDHVVLRLIDHEDKKTALRDGLRPIFNEFLGDWAEDGEKSELDHACEEAADCLDGFVPESLVDAIWDVVEQQWNDHYEPDNPSLRYDSGSFIIETFGDGDLVVIKSPYFCVATGCSPCAPNAGHLDSTNRNPGSGRLKTYCLDEEWYDTEERLTYPYFRVDDGTLAYKHLVGGDCEKCPLCKKPMAKHEIGESCPVEE